MSPNRNELGLRVHGSIVRPDEAHHALERHALTRSRVRQVLTGALTGSHGSPRRDRTPGPARANVVERFRRSFLVLSDVVRDPALLLAEDGALLDDVKEALCLSEVALSQLDSESFTSGVLDGVADGVDRRVESLVNRVDYLNRLRQRMYRLSAILDGVPFGQVPNGDDIETMARDIMADRVPERSLTFVCHERPSQSLEIAAHALNVAQLVAGIVLQDPVMHHTTATATVAALLHDFGLMRLTHELSNDAPSLSEPQRSIHRQHALYSADIVEQMQLSDREIVRVVAQHHEYLDGSGYPHGLSASQIRPLARLVAVADAYVNLQTAQRESGPPDSAVVLGEIERLVRRGKLDATWAIRLPPEPPKWLCIPSGPEPPARGVAAAVHAA